MRREGSQSEQASGSARRAPTLIVPVPILHFEYTVRYCDWVKMIFVSS